MQTLIFFCIYLLLVEDIYQCLLFIPLRCKQFFLKYVSVHVLPSIQHHKTSSISFFFLQLFNLLMAPVYFHVTSDLMSTSDTEHLNECVGEQNWTISNLKTSSLVCVEPFIFTESTECRNGKQQSLTAKIYNVYNAVLNKAYTVNLW